MRRSKKSRVLVRLSLLLAFAAPYASTQELPNLPPLTNEDLRLEDLPQAKGAAAVILYNAVETDNNKSFETHSVRIKVLREEGKKYANLEIPYFNKEVQVQDIRARTISVDGKKSEFAAQIFDQEILKARKLKVLAKVLTLSDVQVGSIIEYTYRLQFKDKIPDAIRHPEQYIFQEGYTYPAANWEVQQDLFVRHAHFVLRKAGKVVEQHSVGLEKLEAASAADGTMVLDVDNIPAQEKEEYAPPQEWLKPRMHLYYAVGFFSSVNYWPDFSRRRSKEYESFLKKSKTIEREAAQLVAGADSDETKLRKIYARVQRVRSLGYEAEKSEKQKKQENLKENKNVEDVLSRGYGYGNELNLLFVALARAAGFQAYPYLVASRKNAFFMPDWPNEYQLNAMVVQVRVGSRDVYLDPATKFCPYGLLPWDETDAGGVRVDALSPGRGATPGSTSADAVIRRTAEFRLTEDGALKGKVEVQNFGQEALTMRLEGLQEDDAARGKELENSLKEMLPQGATVNLLHTEGWEGSEGPVRASFEVEVPNYATTAGRRLVMPASVFHTNQRNPFVNGRRVNPIYFSYPQEIHEEVKFELPGGMKVEALPAAEKSDQKAVYYESVLTSEGQGLRLSRTIRFSGYLFEKQQYPALQQFYNRVMRGDSEQAILVPATENAGKQKQ